MISKKWREDLGEPIPESLSISSLINATYASISTITSEEIGSERLRRICAPFARLILTQRDEQQRPTPLVMTLDEYLECVRQRFEGIPIYEYETARQTHQFGAIATVFSAWTARIGEDRKIVTSGINSIQLFNDGHRWWLLSLIAEYVRDDLPIPESLQHSQPSRLGAFP